MCHVVNVVLKVFGLRAVGGRFFGGGELVQGLSLFGLKACFFRGLDARIVLSSWGAYKLVAMVSVVWILKGGVDSSRGIACGVISIFLCGSYLTHCCFDMHFSLDNQLLHDGT